VAFFNTGSTLVNPSGLRQVLQMEEEVGVKGARPNQSDSHGGGAHREATMVMANRPISARLARADDLGRSIGKKRTEGDRLEVSWVVGLMRTGEGDVELSSTSMPKRGGKGERVGARLGHVEEEKGGAQRLDCGVERGPATDNSRKQRRQPAGERAGDQHMWGAGGSGTAWAAVGSLGQLLCADSKGNSVVLHLFKNFSNGFESI
jgi:hypothetical protein